MDRQAANQDWAGLADWVRENLFEARRGVLRRAGRLVVFGNDGHSTPAVRREVELVRGWLEARGYAVEGPDTDAAGCTWAMVAVPPAGTVAVTEPVEHALWQCHAQAEGRGSDPGWRARRDREQDSALRVCDARRGTP
jgi:hypothetical protein